MTIAEGNKLNIANMCLQGILLFVKNGQLQWPPEIFTEYELSPLFRMNAPCISVVVTSVILNCLALAMFAKH